MTVPGQGQEPAPSTGQEPAGVTATSTQPATTGQGQEPAPRQAQPEQYDADYVKGLRKSEADARKKLQDAEARLKEVDDQKLSETERLQKRAEDAEKRAAEAETRTRQALVRSAVMVELGKQGAVNPTRIFALVDQAEIALGDDGNVSGADKAVEKLLKDEPYLKASEAGAPGATRPVPGTPKPAGKPGPQDQIDDIYKRIKETSGTPRW